MSEHTTLLRCPFCNGTPELRETGGWSGVGCNTNKCPAYLHALMFRTPAEAIAAWNRRSYATALCQQGELLRQAREFIDTVHDGEYGYSECTRDELVEKIDEALSTSEGRTK